MFFNANENSDVEIVPSNIANHILIAISAKIMATGYSFAIMQPYFKVLSPSLLVKVIII